LALLVLGLLAVLFVRAYLKEKVREYDAAPPAAAAPAAAPAATPADDPIVAPPAEDQPEDATPDRPPVRFPEPADEMQKQFMDRLRNTVSFVFDGDTVMTADGRRIRYLGVNAPEKNEPYFQEATDLNRRLVEMKSVQFTPCAKRPRDKYDRELAAAFVEGAAVEEQLLTAGLAAPFDDPQCVPDCRKNWNLFLDAYRKKRGMFRDAPDEPTPAVIADRLIGQYGLVVGVVDNVRETSAAYHLNFGSDWTTDFTVTIGREFLEPFLRDKLAPHNLTGLELTVFGKVVASYGPHIFADCPAQIVHVAAPRR